MKVLDCDSSLERPIKIFFEEPLRSSPGRAALKLGDYISGRIFRRENPAAKSQNWKQGQMEQTPWSVQTVAWQCSGLETPLPPTMKQSLKACRHLALVGRI